ncbi:hypothetical protein O6H91_18G024200 [Diphasiastrum complanatum]|uniref:Uncharacterized protein n=1 Tax=Diphasiastrum complanatum TaxID=34168 RepID=A0ACC2AYX0_DIPCM|nr:hypothetical protein O6H91_18G024200 [Diphasiastrum complanatum]
MATRDLSNFVAAVPVNIVKGSVAVEGRGMVAPLQQAEALQRRWVPDERDAFIAWLRGEFAAANAIIDAMCQHLQMTGKTGEYDFVLACIQQRRFNWTAVLHMQQYFSVAEVVFALQQVALKKQQENNPDNNLLFKKHSGSVEREVRSSSKAGQNGVTAPKDQRYESVNSGNTIIHFAGGENQSRKDSSEEVATESGRRAGERREIKKPIPALPSDNSSARNSTTEARPRQTSANHNVGNSRRGTESGLLPVGEKLLREVANMDRNKDNVHATEKTDCQSVPSSNLEESGGLNGDKASKASSKEDDMQKLTMLKVSRNLSCFVEIEGQMVNLVEGLELYENVVDIHEAAKLVTLANMPQLTGRMGTNKADYGGASSAGHAFISSKRLAKGNVKELIQFGTVPTEVLEDHRSLPFILKEESADPMPAALELVIDRLVRWKIFPANKRPDACIIQILEEGSAMLPSHSHNFEEPFCILPLLSDCSLSLSHAVPSTSSGDSEGFTLSLSIGSVLVLEGKSSDLAQHAVFTSPPKQILLTFGKMLDKASNVNPMDNESSISPDPLVVPGSGKTLETPTRPGSKHPSHSGHGPSFKGNHAPVKVKTVSPLPGVLPVPAVRSPGQIHHTPGAPVFPSNNGNAGAYSTVAVMTPGWSTIPGIRLPSAGTGVFLPFIGGSTGASQTINGTQRQQGIATSLPLSQNMNQPTVPGSSQNGSSAASTVINYSKSSMPVQVLDQDFGQLTERTQLTMIHDS